MKTTTKKASEKQCGGPCRRVLPLSEFGVARSRKDGRNLYCKRCVCAKVQQSRDHMKEYKAAQHLRKLARERQQQIAAAAVSACEVNGKTLSAQTYCDPCAECQEWLWHGVLHSGLIAPRL